MAPLAERSFRELPGAKRLLASAALLIALQASGGCGQAPPAPVAPQALAGFERPAGQGPEATIRHGERLAKVLGCRGCHGENFTGEDWSEPGFSTQFTSNLTRVIANYNDTQFVHAIREGRRPDGSALWEMPSATFTHLGDADLLAVTAYLRSRPAAGADHPRLVVHERGRRAIAAGEWRSSPDDVAAERAQVPARLDGPTRRAI